ncbi:MAG: hypothetical protein QOI31_1052 [Solirubrobacterales bacterium]|jgi:hypothetical protein|nr:hypothetical protein [Solirubrobacterales bacterium]
MRTLRSVAGSAKGLRAAVLAGAVLALLPVTVALAAQGDTTSLSVDENGDEFDSATFDVSFSQSGRFVAFSSTASGLDPADTSPTSDVFVLDRKQDDIELVSRESASKGGEVGNNVSVDASISASGRYVAFESAASNLSGADNTTPLDPDDIYVYDRKLDKVTLAARRRGAGAGANDESQNPSISADGRFVAFDSIATNLAKVDKDEDPDVYVRDLRDRRTILASRKGRKGQDANAPAENPSISADGTTVGFQTTAMNLGGPLDGSGNVYVRELDANLTQLVSRESGQPGDGASGSSEESAVSANGRYVAFRSSATELSNADSGSVDVFVYDRKEHTVQLVSRESQFTGGEGADNGSFAIDISDSGRYVSFRSSATNLSGVDLNAVIDVFVRDRTAKTTDLVSRVSGGGAGADGDCFVPVISPTGRYVGFLSIANNLSTEDDDAQQNAFSHDFLGP